MNTLSFLSRLAASCIGIIWCWIEPTVPFLAICVFAILLDCLTAWRCNRRIYAKFREEIKRTPSVKVDGKLKSQHMSKMIGDMCIIFLCVILAYHVDNTMLMHLGDLHLASYVSAVYCMIQFVSIIENESTCNGSTWARVMQRLVADKTERHLGIKYKELVKQINECDSTNC